MQCQNEFSPVACWNVQGKKTLNAMGHTRNTQSGDMLSADGVVWGCNDHVGSEKKQDEAARQRQTGTKWPLAASGGANYENDHSSYATYVPPLLGCKARG